MIVKRTARAIVLRLNERKLVTFPIDDPAALQRIANGYSGGSHGVIDRCVGSLDGIAVRIRKPQRKYAPKKYWCRKGFHAINVQAMCDSKRRFTFVSIMSGGSTHDSTAFNLSWVGRQIADNLFPEWYIMGDAAYQSGDSILVPWTLAGQKPVV